MLGSFRLSTNQLQGVEVKEFHTNLWFINPRNFYLDVGLWFEFGQDSFFENDSFTFELHSPFPIKSSLVHLYDKMCNEQILQLLFNEDFNQGTVIVGQNTIHFLDFHAPQKGSFLILKPELERASDNSINIELRRTELTRAALVSGRFLREEDGGQKIGVYIRFRYEIKAFKESNIDITDLGFHKKVLIDLRVNDIRSVGNDIATRGLVEVKTFMFFIILPSSFEIQASQPYRYGRMLEQKWHSYIDHKMGRQFLVYYWKREGLNKDSFNLLIGAKQEKDTVRALLRVLILLAAFAILIFINERFNFIATLGMLAPVFQRIINWAAWLTALVIALIIGNALWDLIKYLYRTTVQPSIARRFKR